MAVDVQMLNATTVSGTYPLGSMISVDIYNAGQNEVIVRFDKDMTADKRTLIPADTSLRVNDHDVRTLYYATTSGSSTIYLTITQN